MQSSGLQKTLQILLLLILGFAALYYAKPFLVPFCLGGLLAMLLLPFCRKLEHAGFTRGMATTFCTLLLLCIFISIIFLITWQVNSLVSDLGNIEGKLQTAWRQIGIFISNTFGISREQQRQVIEQQAENADDGVARLSAYLFSMAVNAVLVLVYVFLFMYYRKRIKSFILQLMPKKENNNTEDALENVKNIAQQYLTGVGLMIICLWIMYSIGFTILGLKHALLFAMLCGLFEIVPFVGNLAGNTLAVLMAVTQGGGISMITGIIITYALVQFLQTYLLEPLVVGAEVNVNPLFTIIGLVLGELVWGIAGLALAIPLMGIVKIICDYTPSLKPYSYLMGYERKKKKNLLDMIKMKFK